MGSRARLPTVEQKRRRAMRRHAVVGVLAILSALLDVLLTPAPAAAAFSTKWATRVWETEIGTAGPVIIALEPSGWGQAWVGLTGLRPSTRYSIALYQGTCAALGSRIAYDRTSTTMDDGTLDWDLNALTPAQMRAIKAAPHVSIAVGSSRRCATFPASSTSCAVRSSPAPWKDLVLVYPGTAVTYRTADGSNATLAASFSAAELDQIRASVAAAPGLASTWSGGTAALRVSVVVVDHALRSVTAQGTAGAYVVTENDIRADLNRYAPIGRYDNVTVIWKASPDAATLSPLSTWGTSGSCVSIHVNSTGFTTLPVTDVAAPLTTEMLHLWLESVAGYYAHFGYGPIPDLNAFGAGGYAYDPTSGWAGFYSAFMTGRVVDAQGAALGGISRTTWASGTPVTRPVGCYWFHDP